jgi:O-antigen/teichoic acid export membrane protein
MTLAAPHLPTSEALPTAKQRSGARRQIRGSSMLFAGRLLAMVVNFGVHVLIVRYLSKTDYGAFAYAMSLVNMGQSVADFGLHRAVSRFVPIYHEQEEYKKLVGTIGLAVVAILSLGVALALGVFCFQGVIGRALIDNQQAVYLLLILVFLSPINALDRLLVNLFAIFASPRSIFFRRYVVGPGLKVLVIGLLIGGHFSVRFLAAGYLAASVIGVAIYSVVLYNVLAKQELLVHFRGPFEVPWRATLLFTIPLLSTDLLHLLTNGTDALLLGYFSGTESVAAIRAVRPTAVLNEVVFASFGILFAPQVARLFARKDGDAINDLYWQTAAWIAILSFPIFLVTCSLAQPVTEFVFGVSYRESGVLLCVLSLGYYVQAAFGFNGRTLTIYGRVGYLAMMNIVVVAASLCLALFLIPRYGALGAAISTSSTLILHNIFKQVGLLLFTDVHLFDRRYLRVYLLVAVGAAGMLGVQLLTEASVFLGIGIAALLSIAMLRINRDLLNVEETFPELLRLPLMPLLLGRNG